MGDKSDGLAGSLNGGDPTLGDVSPSSSPSSQDQDHDLDLNLDGDDQTLEEKQNAPPPPQKRKGGRKPIYATSEERKQRNRQAQAAFRERRTEYIKQLETTIKRHEESLAGLQQSQRQALDECLMLRYKNSLLERILVEKGIDVQAELQAKNSSPNFGPTRPPASAPSGPQGLNRFPASKYGRRPLSISAKPDPNHPGDVLQNRSPLSQPNSASHLPSPIAPLARSPNFLPQAGTISPSFGPTGAQPGQQIRTQQPLRPQPFTQQQNRATAFQTNAAAAMSSAQSSASGSSMASAPRDPQGFFVPAFQNHYDQLDQEYDAQANMLDEQESDAAFPTASFSAPSLPPQQQGLPQLAPAANPNVPQHSMAPPQQQSSDVAMNANFDQYDPILDADPFGLSASMHFPTQFSYDPQR